MMAKSRRDFLKTLVVGSSGRTVLGLGSPIATTETGPRLLVPKTGSRRRRIIYNDDSGATYPKVAGANPRATEGPEGFLSARFHYTIGTQVDSYWWCVGDGQIPPFGSWGEDWKIPEAIGDPIQVIIDAARRDGKEVFASLKMNDTHDALPEYPITYPLKVQHPDYMIAPKLKYHESQIEYWVSSALNYAIPEVRKHRLEFIEQRCRKYDFDGFEMDFMRHATFFNIGEEKKHISVMTEFVRRVRSLLRQVGKERGRPILLAARVADTPQLSLGVGLDTEQWLKEGLLDILVVGAGYAPFTTPVQEYIGLGHRYGLPVYPCANYSLRAFDHPEAQRGMATNFFSAGADGIYLFNAFVTVDHRKQDPKHVYGLFHEIGDPATMRFKDKLFVIEPTRPGPHMARITAPFQLPLKLLESRALNLLVGEDLSSEPTRRKLKEIRLQLTTEGVTKVDVRLNGVTLDGGRDRMHQDATEPGTSSQGTVAGRDLRVPASALRKGSNRLEVTAAGKKGTLKGVQLWVRYLS